MTSPPSPLPPLSYQPSSHALPFANRSGQLITVGILLILAGFVTGCFTAVSPLALAVPPQNGRPPPRVMEIVNAMLIYGVCTTVLAWLGIGAIMRRRWSRPLTVILATHWLLVGLVAMIVIPLMYPIMRDMLRQDLNLPPEMPVIALISMLVASFVAFVLVPGIVLLLLRLSDVQKTLEHFDPKPRWTDRCPIQILGLSITLHLAGILFAMGAFYGVMPFFGIVLTGIPAALASLVLGGLLIVSGWLVYRLKMSGWWMGLLVIVGFCIAMLPTTFVIPIDDYYRLFGTPESQIEVFVKHEDLLRLMAVGFPVLFAASWAIYMIRLRPMIKNATPS